MLFRAKYHQHLPAYSIESLICLNSVGGYYTERCLAYGKEAGKDEDRHVTAPFNRYHHVTVYRICLWPCKEFQARQLVSTDQGKGEISAGLERIITTLSEQERSEWRQLS